MKHKDFFVQQVCLPVSDSEGGNTFASLAPPSTLPGPKVMVFPSEAAVLREAAHHPADVQYPGWVAGATRWAPPTGASTPFLALGCTAQMWTKISFYSLFTSMTWAGNASFAVGRSRSKWWKWRNSLGVPGMDWFQEPLLPRVWRSCCLIYSVMSNCDPID